MTMTVVFLAAAILVPAAEPAAIRAESSVSLGMNSCTASACHGGPAGVKKKDWNSSYTVWATKDPHADAFEVLYGTRSVNIVARLTAADVIEPKKEPKRYRAFLEQRCLACHATVTEGRHSTDGFAEDGVSCASCHGVAGAWLGSEHAGKLIKTKDLTTRAKVCVDCHVGAPARNGEPGREVNHDLIAAGHPRLNFEFAAYLSNLPAHWDVEKDRNRIRQQEGAQKAKGNFAAQTWVTGQLVAANAALELLESRATADGQADQDRIWPEFSEISCYACHHDLRAPSYRQQLFQRESPTKRRSPLGSLVWGTWYSPMSRRFLMPQDAGAANAAAPWIALEQTLNSLRPDPTKVLEQSSSVRKLLSDNLTPAVNSQQTIERLSKSILGRPEPRSDWDEVTQWYLAAVAWHQALLEEQAGRPIEDQAKTRQREQALKESETTLEKLRGLLESPNKFDPTGESFQKAVDLLLQQLATLDG